jgi:hypothetical protein
MDKIYVFFAYKCSTFWFMELAARRMDENKIKKTQPNIICAKSAEAVVNRLLFRKEKISKLDI